MRAKPRLRQDRRAVVVGLAAFGAFALWSAGSRAQDNTGQHIGGDAGAGVAQRAVLYEEDPDKPNGLRFTGSTVWSSDAAPSGTGAPPEIVVRARIVVPDRAMTLIWELRRNGDAQLSASHLVGLTFVLAPNRPHGGIGNVPGLLAKSTEEKRGAPLAGLTVKVTDDYFLIGLSSEPANYQHNMALLKEQSWFDLAIVYGDGRRAILAFEKGPTGTRAIEAALAAWESEKLPAASPAGK
jgi:hypothetical protein